MWVKNYFLTVTISKHFMQVIGRIFIKNISRYIRHSKIRTDDKINIFSIKPKLKLIFFPLFSQFFEKTIQKKYKLPCCYDNNLQILHVPKI